MELEEMKATWETLSKRIEKQENLTNQMINKMIDQNYRSKLRRIAIPEYIGTIVCYIGAAYLITNFTKINTISMQVCCIADILLLFTLPIISLKSIGGIKNIHIATQGYSEAIREYASQRIRFQKLQKWNTALSMLLMLTSIPVVTSILGKEISDVPNFWTLIFPLGIIFSIIFSLWVLRCYNKILKEAEEVLLEAGE